MCLFLGNETIRVLEAFFSAFYGNEEMGENIGVNCNFQFFTLLVVKIRGMAPILLLN